MLRIDRSQGEDLEDAYDRARYWVLEAASRAGGRELERLTLVESDLDSLVHSRQQDINFGELCVLFIFCSITVGLALSARPDAGGFICLHNRGVHYSVLIGGHFLDSERVGPSASPQGKCPV